MFTIKVRDSVALGQGERLYSAETIEVVWPGPATNPPTPGASNIYEAGIYLDPEPPPPIAPEDREPGGRLHGPWMAKNIILFGHDATSDGEKRKGGKVWVMNEAGQTVASYDL